jgi:hypothetical protein
MVQLLGGLITYLLLAIYCQEQHQEPVSSVCTKKILLYYSNYLWTLLETKIILSIVAINDYLTKNTTCKNKLSNNNSTFFAGLAPAPNLPVLNIPK